MTLPDDFEGGAPLRIALDPARGPRDNAERLYKEHKRLSRALRRHRRAPGRRARRARARRAPSSSASSRAPRCRAAALVPATSARRASASATAPRRPTARSAPPTGAQILVGRGADRNDELTFQVARGNDLWLHARDVPGAHVIVPPAAGGRIDEQTLLDAATLAAHHSNARGEAQVDVGYTLRKHVRKPPQIAPRLGHASAGPRPSACASSPSASSALLASRVGSTADAPEATARGRAPPPSPAVASSPADANRREAFES